MHFRITIIIREEGKLKELVYNIKADDFVDAKFAADIKGEEIAAEGKDVVAVGVKKVKACGEECDPVEGG